MPPIHFFRVIFSLFKLFLLTCLISCWPQSSDNKIQKFPLQLNSKLNVKVTAVTSKHSKFSRFFDLSSEKINGRIQVKTLKANVASHLIRTKVAGVQGAYLPARSPYPGQITSEVNCPVEKRALSRENISDEFEKHIVVGGVSDRKVFGACFEPELKFLGGLLFYYDVKRETLFEFKVSTTHLTNADVRKELTEFMDWLDQLVPMAK